jgi:[protein-PII] uridylyltransferase
MEQGELAASGVVEAVENKKRKLLGTVTSAKEKKEIKKQIEVLPPRYLLYTTEREILEHYRLYSGLGGSDFVWEVEKPLESNTRLLTVCAKDRPGLFSKMAGVFTLNGLDILDARINTWKNRIALDIFTLKPPVDQIFEDQKWAAAKKDLESALSGELDLAVALKEKMSDYIHPKPHMMGKPHRIEVDNKSSSFFTIVEVFTYDYKGLLYSITNALFSCRLDIQVAKIATKADQVVDVFYVVDFEGQKVDSEEQVASIKGAISEVLPKPVL